DLKYTEGAIYTAGRGDLRPMFELIYNHYANRRGIAVAFTKEAAEKIRLERGAIAGHPQSYVLFGYGTLAYTLNPLKEIASLSVPYTMIISVGTKDTAFIDKNVTNGSTYYYVIVGEGSGVWKGKASAELEARQKLVTQYDFEDNLKDSAGQNHAVAAGSPKYSP